MFDTKIVFFDFCTIKHHLNKLTNNVEYIFINGLHVDDTFNLPISIKEIHIRGIINIRKLSRESENEFIKNMKIPFGCKIYKMNTYKDIETFIIQRKYTTEKFENIVLKTKIPKKLLKSSNITLYSDLQCDDELKLNLFSIKGHIFYNIEYSVFDYD